MSSLILPSAMQGHPQSSARRHQNGAFELYWVTNCDAIEQTVSSRQRIFWFFQPSISKFWPIVFDSLIFCRLHGCNELLLFQPQSLKNVYVKLPQCMKLSEIREGKKSSSLPQFCIKFSHFDYIYVFLFSCFFLHELWKYLFPYLVIWDIDIPCIFHWRRCQVVLRILIKCKND